MVSRSTTSPPSAREQETYARGGLEVEAPSTTDPASGRPAGSIGRAYEGFLRLPVAMVLITLWLCGVALISTFFVLLYLIGESLLRAAG